MKHHLLNIIFITVILVLLAGAVYIHAVYDPIPMWVKIVVLAGIPIGKLVVYDSFIEWIDRRKGLRK